VEEQAGGTRVFKKKKVHSQRGEKPPAFRSRLSEAPSFKDGFHWEEKKKKNKVTVSGICDKILNSYQRSDAKEKI